MNSKFLTTVSVSTLLTLTMVSSVFAKNGHLTDSSGVSVKDGSGGCVKSALGKVMDGCGATAAPKEKEMASPAMIDKKSVAPGSHKYVGDSSGKAVRDSSGECVRSATGSMFEECGPAPKPVVKKPPPQPPVVIAPPPPPKPVVVKKPRVVPPPPPKPAPRPAPPKVYVLNLNETGGSNFAFDSSKLNDKGKGRLSHFVNMIKKSAVSPSRVIIVGHTDSIGTEAYNQKLSERRAQSVADHLTTLSIAQNTMHISGRGETQPVATNKTKAGRAQNRRVIVNATGKRRVIKK